MKEQKKKKKQLGVDGINPSGQNPNGENPNGETLNVESPKKESDASLVPYLVDAGDHSPNFDDSYFDSFPPGYRFRPHDGELVFCYLLRKLLNQPLPPNQIKVVELYRYNPNTLTERYKSLGEMEWYFFTPRDRKYRKGQRPNRAAADGYWKATGADRPVKHNGNLVGFKKALVFYKGKAPKGDKTDWIMHEYIVNNPPQKQKGGNDMRLDDWVLCRIYKKKNQSAKASTRKRENSEQDFQSRSVVPTQSQDKGQISVDENPKMLPTRDIFKPEGHGIFDLSDYYNQGRFFSAYDNVLLSCQSPYVNFQNGQVNYQNSIPQSCHSPLGLQQTLHHNPSSVAESSPSSLTILPKDQITSPIKPEQFGYLPDELLNLPLEDNCFDPLAHNFTDF